jgi:hypothetical protein
MSSAAHNPKSLKTFTYSPDVADAIERAISAERFRPYLRRAGGSRIKAVLLYERNTAISEALYGVMQSVEICIRNSIHRTLTEDCGSDWLERAPLTNEHHDKVRIAKRTLQIGGKTVTPSGIVAELGLGFWTGLISRHYHDSLWIPSLHKAFPNAIIYTSDVDGSSKRSKMNRSDIHDCVERLRRLRNRIAHHEQILKLDLPRLYAEAISVIGWICPISQEWVRATNCFNQRFHERPLEYSPLQYPEEPVKSAPGKPRA